MLVFHFVRFVLQDSNNYIISRIYDFFILMRILSVFLHLSGGHNEQAPGHGHPTGGGVPRSRTVPPQEPIFTNALKSASTLELERRAKVEAERAAKVKQTTNHNKALSNGLVFPSFFFVQNRKVFTIIGPYHTLRKLLRKRGWVEKFLNAPVPGDMNVYKKKAPVTNPDDPGLSRSVHHMTFSFFLVSRSCIRCF